MTLHAFYSEKAIRAGYDSCFYKTVDGELIEGTAFYSNKAEGEERYKFDDKIYVEYSHPGRN